MWRGVEERRGELEGGQKLGADGGARPLERKASGVAPSIILIYILGKCFESSAGFYLEQTGM